MVDSSSTPPHVNLRPASPPGTLKTIVDALNVTLILVDEGIVPESTLTPICRFPDPAGKKELD